MGERTLHGPHHVALKSNKNGTEDLSTSVSKFRSLISSTLAADMASQSPLRSYSYNAPMPRCHPTARPGRRRPPESWPSRKAGRIVGDETPPCQAPRSSPMKDE